jgi:hypothetical protein
MLFSRQWFLQLFRALHLVPPLATPGGVHPRGSKIKNVSEDTDTKCKEYYVPREHVSVHESTVGFKGRVQWKCYSPKRLTMWSLRICCPCDSVNGSIFSHVLYYGKSTTDSLVRPDLTFTS